ncbi:MAG: ABC transporter ATP-binding protein [Cocleimonas sp.]|nr:ABC transporter ATP-binding protein [Cocleimonas sp.]
MSLLKIENLSVQFQVDGQPLYAVRDVTLHINKGESVAIVGESGSGKSQIFHSVLGLNSARATIKGEIIYADQSLLNQSETTLNTIRGRHISLIMQDAISSLNPYLKIGLQLTEVLEHHYNISRKAAKPQAIAMLKRVHIDQPEKRFDSYPHELSGGMLQRVVIAMAVLCRPKLMIADEPTTALDAPIQYEIIQLLADIHQQENTSIVLITHDLSLVSSLCQRIVVLYAGRIIESGSVNDIMTQARHPYTKALLSAAFISGSYRDKKPLQSIQGEPPNPMLKDQGCAFYPRCQYARDQCKQAIPDVYTASLQHQVACFREDIK